MYGQINKLFIIGNGFDLAHGLNTRYFDFINFIWEKEKEFFINAINNQRIDFKAFHYNSNLLSIKIPVSYYRTPGYSFIEDAKGFNYFRDHVDRYPYLNYSMNNEKKIKLSIKNRFIQHISEKNSLVNWVDIEEEYYYELKYCLNNNNDDDIKKLNLDFDSLRSLLKNYLSLEARKEIILIPQIIDKLNNILQPELIAGNQTLNNNDHIFFLNFNYTNTDKQYIDYYKKIIPQTIESMNIHGELNNENNPIIFGYGDELDEDHKIIENKNEPLPKPENNRKTSVNLII